MIKVQPPLFITVARGLAMETKFFVFVYSKLGDRTRNIVPKVPKLNFAVYKTDPKTFLFAKEGCLTSDC